MQTPRPASIITIPFFIVISVAGSSVNATNTERPHKVEYAEVRGSKCLQPVASSADATLSDYRDAEERWIAKHDLGERSQFSEGVLSPMPEQLETETLHFHAADGTETTVCFDIHAAADSKPANRLPMSYRYRGHLGYTAPDGSWAPLVPDGVFVGRGVSGCELDAQTPVRVNFYPDGAFTLDISLETEGSSDPRSDITTWPCYRFRVRGCDDAVTMITPMPPGGTIEMSCPNLVPTFRGYR